MPPLPTSFHRRPHTYTQRRWEKSTNFSNFARNTAVKLKHTHFFYQRVYYDRFRRLMFFILIFSQRSSEKVNAYVRHRSAGKVKVARDLRFACQTHPPWIRLRFGCFGCRSHGDGETTSRVNLSSRCVRFVGRNV